MLELVCKIITTVVNHQLPGLLLTEDQLLGQPHQPTVEQPLLMPVLSGTKDSAKDHTMPLTALIGWVAIVQDLMLQTVQYFLEVNV
jgi:hypothetical protein